MDKKIIDQDTAVKALNKLRDGLSLAVDRKIIDQDTAVKALNKLRDGLSLAVDRTHMAGEVLRDELVRARPLGVLTVDQMATVIGRDRNYIDSVWSNHGETVRGKQTRVAASGDVDGAEALRERLSRVAHDQQAAVKAESVLRAERDRVVTMVYASKLLGPTAIAREVGVDRNHVLRIARKGGAGPAHRTGSKNQYTSK